MTYEVPSSRVEPVNQAPVRADGEFVLYWMIASRRTRWSFAVERALERCQELGLGLVVLEAQR